ncbi:MAG: Maf family protein [Gammaproteobacteria bacterium]|nr:Maf family protein [Gammaproteobacteria bacterium]
MTTPAIYLASRSPRRGALLQQIGVPFTPLAVDVPETRQPKETPEEFVQRLALDKARAGWQALQRQDELPVLGADTAVILENQVLGKPAGPDEAVAMLTRLSGRSHRVLSGVALVRGAREAVRLSASIVRFRATTAAERRRYCATGEPLDKAGAYAIQGLAAAFVSRLEGSYSGVMGLPLYETVELLTAFGAFTLGGSDD